MRPFSMMKAACICIALCLAGAFLRSPARAQETAADERNSSQQTETKETHHGRSAKGDVGSGSADIGKGAAKGAGDVAKGTGKGAVDLATLHPIDAATDVGRGAVTGGAKAGTGAAKGTGKILRGAGKAFKHIF